MVDVEPLGAPGVAQIGFGLGDLVGVVGEGVVHPDKLIKRVSSLTGTDGPVDEEATKQFKEKFLTQVGSDLNTSMGITPSISL